MTDVRRSGGRNEFRRRIAALALVTVAVAFCTAHAQDGYRFWADSTLPPERKPFRVAPTEFPIGTYALSYPPDRPIEELWPYFADLDISAVVTWSALNGYSRDRFDSLLYSPLRPEGATLIPAILGPSKLGEAGHAQRIVFYPFDSSEMRAARYYRPSPFEHLFTRFVDDSTRMNRHPAGNDPEGSGLRESVYTPGQAGLSVASGVAYDWRPSQRLRFPEERESGSWRSVCRECDTLQNTDLPFTDRRRIPAELYYFTLKGHLFPDGDADPGATIFRMNFWYEIPRGSRYHDSSGAVRRAETNLRLLYASRPVTKSDLSPTDTITPDWEAYRDVTFPIRLDSCDDCGMRGPLGAGNESRRMDIEIVYKGSESVALRSVTMRDSVAFLLSSDTPEGRAYRDTLLAETAALVVDSSTGFVNDGILSLSPFGETHPIEYGGYSLVNEIFRNNFRNAEGDSLHYYVEIALPYTHHLGGAELALPEVYFNKLGLQPESHCCVEAYPWGRLFEVEHNQVPSIREHNGGRWNIPELFDLSEIDGDTDSDDLLDDLASYEETLQTMFFGRYGSLEQPWPYNSTAVVETGRYSRTARANGIRMMPIVGPTTGFRITPVDTRTGRRDTLVSHRQEAAELRALTNLLVFGYGAKGLIYFLREADPWLDPDPSADRLNCCMGYGGETVDQIDMDITDWALRVPGTRDTVLLIDDFYLGYRTVYEEMRRQHPWLIRIGERLSGLRWRDAYSISWSERRPEKDRSMPPRPLPADEIVTGVRAVHPVTGRTDRPWETYVELGLYDTERGRTGGTFDPMLDTNYVGVCNRRAFETIRPYDFTYSERARNIMDTLTETRTILLDLNLRHPMAAADQPENRVRVREVEPDVTPLPLIGTRTPLDTIVDASGRVELTLGPGRAALLEITYVAPNLLPGDGNGLFMPGSGRNAGDGTGGRDDRSDVQNVAFGRDANRREARGTEEELRSAPIGSD